MFIHCLSLNIHFNFSLCVTVHSDICTFSCSTCVPAGVATFPPPIEHTPEGEDNSLDWLNQVFYSNRVANVSRSDNLLHRMHTSSIYYFKN